MRIAIITGASSGLGAEYIKQIDKKYRFSELWIIARRKKRLENIARETRTKVRVLAMDLTDTAMREKLASILAKTKPVVGLLINAAGMGKIGRYDEIGPQNELAMIRLNCEAAVAVTQIVLPYMRKGSRIMQICSTAAFQPLQGLSVYAASKAFLLRYSRGLGAELLGTGIRVTAVCPYWIKDTEFIPVAKETESSAVRHFPFASVKRSVAAVSLWVSKVGFPVCTPGIFCTIHRIISIIPDTVLMLGWEGIRRI